MGDFGLKTGKRAKFVHFGHVFSENERFSAIFGRFLKKSAITLKEPYSQPQINTDGHGLGIEQVGRSRRDRRDRTAGTAEQPDYETHERHEMGQVGRAGPARRDRKAGTASYGFHGLYGWGTGRAVSPRPPGSNSRSHAKACQVHQATGMAGGMNAKIAKEHLSGPTLLAGLAPFAR